MCYASSTDTNVPKEAVVSRNELKLELGSGALASSPAATRTPSAMSIGGENGELEEKCPRRFEGLR